MYMGLDAANQMLILKEIVHFRLKLVQSILVVHAKCNFNNEVALDLDPLVMPFQLIEMAPWDFIDLVLNSYQSELAKFWPDEKIDLIEQHKK